ncbi:winged helix-turn-helix transcriptional regulator [Paenibacillus oryzisoli]
MKCALSPQRNGNQRVAYAVIPPKVEYSITEYGRTLD